MAVQLLLPGVAGFRLGVGPTYGRHHVEVALFGRDTGRREEPLRGKEGSRSASGRLMTLEWRGSRWGSMRVEAGYERMRIDFGPCYMDVWALCGRPRFERYTFGVRQPVR